MLFVKYPKDCVLWIIGLKFYLGLELIITNLVSSPHVVSGEKSNGTSLADTSALQRLSLSSTRRLAAVVRCGWRWGEALWLVTPCENFTELQNTAHNYVIRSQISSYCTVEFCKILILWIVFLLTGSYKDMMSFIAHCTTARFAMADKQAFAIHFREIIPYIC